MSNNTIAAKLVSNAITSLYKNPELERIVLSNKKVNLTCISYRGNDEGTIISVLKPSNNC